MSEIAQRRHEEKERRRNEILDAAEKVAAEVGLEAMTMDQVARCARLSRALIYVYFHDKTDLLFGLVQRSLVLLRARFFEAAARHGRGLDQIEAMGRAYVAFAKAFPLYFELLGRFEAHEAGTGEPGGNFANCVLAGNRVQQLLVEALQRGIADGSVRPDVGEPMVVAFTLYGFTHGAVQVATTRAAVLPLHGVSPEALIEHALLMARRSLAAREA